MNPEKPILIGLDINPTYIALTELQKTNTTYELISYAFVPITESAPQTTKKYYYDEEQNNSANQNATSLLQKALAIALEHARPTTRNTTIALPHSDVYNKNITLNNQVLKTVKIEPFLHLNSEKLFSTNLADNYFDYHILPTDTSLELTQTATTTINIAIVSKNIVNRYIDLINSANLTLTAVDIDTYALIRASLFLYPKITETYTIINIDQEKLLLVSVKYKQLNYAKEINLQNIDQQNIAELSSSIIEQLTIADTENNSHSKTIILCGSQSSAQLADTLKSASNITILLADPFQKIIIAPNLQQHMDELQQKASGLMLSLGLALHEEANNVYPDSPKQNTQNIFNNLVNFNLLPWRATLQKKQQRKFKIIWIGTIFGCILFTIIWHLLLQKQITTQDSQLKQLQQNLYTLQTQKTQLESIQQKLIKIQQQDLALKAIENNQQRNLELLALISKSIPSIAKIESIEKNNSLITLKGEVYSLSALPEFIQKISNASWLGTPTLQEIVSSDNPTIPEKKFILTINQNQT